MNLLQNYYLVSMGFALSLVAAIWLFYIYQSKKQISSRLNGLNTIKIIKNERSNVLAFLNNILPASNVPPEKASEQNMLLWNAGFRNQNAGKIFICARICFVIIFTAIAYLARLAYPIIALSGIMGFFLPKVFVNYLVTRRNRTLEKELPYALDLMVVLIEAGLGLESTIKRVSDELSIKGCLLGIEMRYLFIELSGGIKKEIAYSNFAKRCNIEEVSALVGMLIQTEKFGVGLAKSLRVQASYTRKKRKQKIEEKIKKLPVKLAFPLFCFYFPVILIITAGPAAISLFNYFGKK